LLDFEADIPWQPPKPVAYEVLKDSSMDFSALFRKMEATNVESQDEIRPTACLHANTEALQPFNSAASPIRLTPSSVIERMSSDIKRRQDSKTRTEIFKESIQRSESPPHLKKSGTSSVFSRLSQDSGRRSQVSERLEVFLEAEAAKETKAVERQLDRRTEEQLVKRLTRKA
jgi:hypothetical protein